MPSSFSLRTLAPLALALAGLIVFIVTARIAAPPRASVRYEACARLALTHPAAAMEQARAWEKAVPETPLPRHCEALALYQLRRYDEASAVFYDLASHALPGKPQAASALLLQAVAGWKAAAHYEEARNALTQALALTPAPWGAPEKTRLLVARAELERWLGNPLSGIQDADYALNLTATDAGALVTRARLYQMTGDFDASNEDAKQAKALGDADGEAARILAENAATSPPARQSAPQ